MSTSARRFRVFSVKQLLLVIAVVALSLVVWHRFTLRSISIRPTHSGDPGIEVLFPGENVEFKSIAVIDGKIHGTEQVHLSLFLYEVQNGRVDGLGDYTLVRRPVEKDDLFGDTGTILIALELRKTPTGLNVDLETDGASSGSGSGNWKKTITFGLDHSDTFGGTLLQGREYVIHAEGDTPIHLDARTNLARFLQSHAGRHLVVTAKLN